MKRLNPWMMNVVTFVVMGLLLMAQGVWAQRDAAPADTLALSPSVISYQGMLTDAGGNPVNTTVSMQFAIYDAPTDGNLKWGPETQSVQISNGLFHVLLGSVTPIDPATLTGALCLDITVNGESMSPREAIAGVMLAIMAQRSVDDFYVSGSVGIGTANPAHKLDVAGMASLEDHQLLNVRGLQLKDWDDDTGGEDNKYRLTARDGAWQFSDGGVVVGNYADGTWEDLATGTLIVEGNVGIGTTNPTHAKVQIESTWMPLAFRDTNQTGAGSLWRMPVNLGDLRFDASQNGVDFSSFETPLRLAPNGDVHIGGSVSCGAMVETNLQAVADLAAGSISRFEEGDLLCWAGERLEKCAAANDRLIQGVSDKSGRPIVIGAEPVKVLGPVRYGDLLVASAVPGYAMVNNDPKAGAVIAQALENFDGEQGIIKAMIRKF